jgi:ubiquinone/menaquinone biosynthesis C-methylase UbiE
MASFKDYFSSHAGIYATARPDYPDELYEYLSGLCARHDLVWDCATGNGQAAVALAKYFNRVIATDASKEQIGLAKPTPKVEYAVAPAENSGLPDASADLITVATAMHWFNFDAFFKEVDRVLKPDGVLAAWSYFSPTVTAEIDAVIERYHDEILVDYWPAEVKKYVAKGYRDLPFPYPVMPSPDFTIQRNWDMRQFLQHLLSWSGTQNYIKANNHNPLEDLIPQLEQVWDPTETKTVSWKIFLKVGRKDG